ncbi:MAG: hypothetical protein ACI9BK_001702, partial [Acidimicrobiales bacterium]
MLVIYFVPVCEQQLATSWLGGVLPYYRVQAQNERVVSKGAENTCRTARRSLISVSGVFKIAISDQGG